MRTRTKKWKRANSNIIFYPPCFALSMNSLPRSKTGIRIPSNSHYFANAFIFLVFEKLCCDLQQTTICKLNFTQAWFSQSEITWLAWSFNRKIIRGKKWIECFIDHATLWVRNKLFNFVTEHSVLKIASFFYLIFCWHETLWGEDNFHVIWLTNFVITRFSNTSFRSNYKHILNQIFRILCVVTEKVTAVNMFYY